MSLTCCSPAVTLVSHAWHDAFYSEPALWSTFELKPDGELVLALSSAPAGQHAAWLAAKLALLRRVAPSVTALESFNLDAMEQAAARCGMPGFLGEVFGLLRPATLQRLELRFWSGMPPGLLARFPNLHSLRLTDCGCDVQHSWPPAVLAAMCGMGQLEDLTLTAASPPEQLLPLVAERLPRLMRLHVTSEQPLPHAEQLTRLTGLQDLLLVERVTDGGCLQPPAPAQLPRLHTYAVVTRDTSSRCKVGCWWLVGQGCTCKHYVS